jgi:hypothetical protein
MECAGGRRLWGEHSAAPISIPSPDISAALPRDIATGDRVRNPWFGASHSQAPTTWVRARKFRAVFSKRVAIVDLQTACNRRH